MTEPTSASDPLIGRTLRAYEIQEQIGISRWGKVYRAIQKSTDRIVAVRILLPELAAMPGKSEHFLEESRTDAALVRIIVPVASSPINTLATIIHTSPCAIAAAASAQK